MEIKEINAKFGKYYRISAILRVGAFSFKVSNVATNLNDIFKYWKLRRNQMVKILEITQPNDWLFKGNYHFNSQTDGLEYEEEDYKITNEELIKWVIYELKTFNSYSIFYSEEENIFRFFSYTNSFNLKPTSKLSINLIK